MCIIIVSCLFLSFVQYWKLPASTRVSLDLDLLINKLQHFRHACCAIVLFRLVCAYDYDETKPGEVIKYWTFLWLVIFSTSPTQQTLLTIELHSALFWTFLTILVMERTQERGRYCRPYKHNGEIAFTGRRVYVARVYFLVVAQQGLYTTLLCLVEYICLTPWSLKLPLSHYR